MAGKILFALLAATALLALAAPPAEATSAGFCILGICEGVAQNVPVAPPVGCQVVVAPEVAGVAPLGSIVVVICP